MPWYDGWGQNNMQFTSFRFFLFAAVVLVLYYGPMRRRQEGLLLAVNLSFCVESSWVGTALMLLTAAGAYVFGYMAGKNPTRKGKFWMRLYAAMQFGLLAVCKIRGTFSGALLPLGISYYTFQAVGYVTDVARGKLPPEKNFSRLVLSLSFFPALVQGPISGYGDLSRKLTQPHPPEKRQIAFGLRRMLWGYFKKLVIADRIAPAVAALRQTEFEAVPLLILTTFYAVEIYGDFTGGMDIAIGFAEALGISLPENFQHPFFSKSVAEFWRRWHKTLGEWMKAYVFYPVSVSEPMRRLGRVTRKKWGGFGRRLPAYIASFVTWVCTALWHGITPNFFLWGMANFTVMTVSGELAPLYGRFHRRFHWKEKRWYGAFEILRTFFLMNLIRGLDLFPDVGTYFRRLFRFAPLQWPNWLELGLTKADYILLLLGCGILLSVSLAQRKWGSLRAWLWQRKGLWYLTGNLLVLSVVLLGKYGVGFQPGNFIYNQF